MIIILIIAAMGLVVDMVVNLVYVDLKLDRLMIVP